MSRAPAQVVLWSRYERPEEVGETVLRFLPGGGAVRVRDVARIESGRVDTGLLAHTNAEPGVSVVVRKRETADILECVDAVRHVVETTPLPSGVHYALVNDESFETRNRLELMANNGMIGVVLVAIVLFGFLTPAAGIWVSWHLGDGADTAGLPRRPGADAPRRYHSQHHLAGRLRGGAGHAGRQRGGRR
jgi:multidrug efflux pump subunit AcrB